MFSIQLEPYKVKRLVGVTRSSLLGVTETGMSFPLDISKDATVTQVSIRRTAGTGLVKFTFFSDSTMTDDVIELELDAGETRVSISKFQAEYQNTDTTPIDKIYLQVDPVDVGTHDFKLSLFYDKL